MDFKKHLENAWHLTLKHIVPLILMTLIMFVVSACTLGILASVMLAGYTQSLVLMVRSGREPSIGDLFSEMRLFLPLLGFSIAVFIATTIGFKFLFLPGLVIALAVTFGCFYVLPLMTDRRLSLIEAIKTSWEMAVKGNPAEHIVVVILYIALMAIGSAVVIGTLFTMPFATVFMVSIFIERTGTAVAAGPPPVPPPPPLPND